MNRPAHLEIIFSLILYHFIELYCAEQSLAIQALVDFFIVFTGHFLMFYLIGLKLLLKYSERIIKFFRIYLMPLFL